jgi:hypothetical protein
MRSSGGRSSYRLAWALLAVGLGGSTLVLAQGKKQVPRSKPKPVAAAASSMDRPSTEVAKAPVARGDAPVTRGDAVDGGARSSPLNPRPEEFPDAGAVSVPAEVDRILGDIATLRARVAAIGDTLFKSRIVVRLETRGDHAKIGKLAVSLDEGIVYSAPPGFELSDETVVYDHAVAPGRHILGIEIDRRDNRSEGFGTGQRSRFAIEVPENQRLETTFRIDDDSDMGSDFPSSQKGSYDLRVRLRARAER